jgi:hypothetical protein
MILPAVATGAAGELDDLRTACDEAVARLVAGSPDTICVIGSAATTAEHPFPYRASFAEWGVPVEAHLVGRHLGRTSEAEVVGSPRPDTAPLPLSVAVGVWLLSRAGIAGCRVVTVAAAAPPEECVQLGERLAHAGRVVLLAMGDGTACRDLKAPGYLDPRAEPFDATVTKALADADPAALLALDPVLADELMVAGRAAWQVLAGAALGVPFRGEVLYDAAPYGVQYTVASWEAA